MIGGATSDIRPPHHRLTFSFSDSRSLQIAASLHGVGRLGFVKVGGGVVVIPRPQNPYGLGFSIR